jgi:hypothetical protein
LYNLTTRNRDDDVHVGRDVSKGATGSGREFSAAAASAAIIYTGTISF